ncbi:MAG: terminase, partial [Gammaproteobacteria bacterium]
KVIQTMRQWRVDFVGVDMTGGYGAGVYDRLVELGYGSKVTGVGFAERAIDDERYKNKRAEIWHTMKMWLEIGCQIPDRDELQQDLCSVTYKFDSTGERLQLESKAEMKKRGIKSPDYGDATALTFFRPTITLDQFGGDSFEPEYDTSG